jgi:mannitol-1-phosphate 5-dehydrogenase
MQKKQQAWFMERIGLVETSIGRMVPLQTPELLDGDPLRICVEAYSALPVNRNAFRAGIPDLHGIQPYAPFSFHIERKLYIHNMGHALTAYCGDYCGCEYIWQSIAIPEIKALVRETMCASANALAQKYNVDTHELYAYVDDLVLRFANRQLGDTVYRVGRDLRRKLAPEDRMVGALRACAENAAGGILLGIALALRFSHNDLAMTAEQSLVEICTLSPEESAYKAILRLYKMAHNGTTFTDLLKGV